MFGLIRKRKHQQIYIRQGEAYRREIEEARAEARRAQAELREFTEGMVLSIDRQPGWVGGVVLRVEVNSWLTRRETPDKLMRYVAEEIMRQLASVRGMELHTKPTDLRETFA